MANTAGRCILMDANTDKMEKHIVIAIFAMVEKRAPKNIGKYGMNLPFSNLTLPYLTLQSTVDSR